MAEFSEIEDAARLFHQKVGMVDSPPVDLHALIPETYKKVYVGPADLGAVNGALVTQMGKAGFYYREGDPEQTRNYVLGHLLWHYLMQSRKGQLDLTRQCLIGGKRPPDAPNINEERDADIFAIEVLVPLDLLEQSVIGFNPNPRNEHERQVLREKAAQLASAFGIPADVMSRRLAVFAARRRPRV